MQAARDTFQDIEQEVTTHCTAATSANGMALAAAHAWDVRTMLAKHWDVLVGMGRIELQVTRGEQCIEEIRSILDECLTAI